MARSESQLLTPERWKRVEDLYHEVLALPETARAQFLAEACADDPAVREEVESLLRHAPDGSASQTLSDVVAAAHVVPLVGRSIGAYQVEALLGAGGMGIVYRARDTRLGRSVAIKVLPAAFAGNPATLSRFEREARVLASLNHPHIATIHGVEDADGVKALVMELIEGRTLEEWIAERNGTPRRRDVREALALARQIAEALEAAHEKGIVHRDLKPANVKVTPDGTAKVLDFGLAREDATDPAAAVATTTSPGLILGTAAYMSPEQARGLPVDKRADIWSFGCVLYEMLAGHRPFDGATASDAIARVITQAPDFAALPPDTPAPIRRLLRRCLEKDSRQRLRDIGDARVEIAQVLEGHEQLAEETRPPARGRWHRAWPWAVATGVALTIGVPASLLLRPSPTEPPTTRLTLATASPLSPTRTRTVAMSADGTRYTYLTASGFAVGFTDGRPEVLYRQQEMRGAADLFFSPDGQWIGYSTGNSLHKVSLAGGNSITLAETPPGTTASWGPDGIVYSNVNGLFRMSADGGPPEQLPMAPLAEGEQAVFPELLPDGRTALLTIVPFRTGAVRIDAAESLGARIDAVDLRTGARRTVVSNGGAARIVGDRYLVYLAGRQPKVIAFDAQRVEVSGDPIDAVPSTNSSVFGGSRSGSFLYLSGGGIPDTEPVWMDRAGRQEPLGAPRLPYIYPELSPDGALVAFVGVNRARGDRDIWIWDIARKVMTQPFDDGTDNPMVAWSPDGLRLAFGSARDKGVINTFWHALDGSGNGRITNSPRVQMPILFTLDQRLLLSADVPGEGRNILSASADGREVIPLLGGPATELSADLSPDGRWLAYDATDSGQFEINIRPYPNVEGGRWVVSRGGGRQPVWSRDGRELFYRDFTGAVMAVAITTSPAFKAAAPVRVLEGAGLLGGGSAGSAQSYAVARDGRFLMLKNAEPADPSLKLVLNWTTELGRLLPR